MYEWKSVQSSIVLGTVNSMHLVGKINTVVIVIFFSAPCVISLLF